MSSNTDLGGTSSRQARKAATRQSLKDAARGCFARSSYAATAIGDITGRAGVAHGTFYVHFPNKEALVDELLEEFNTALATELAVVFGDVAGRSVTDVVRAIAETMLDHWAADRVFIECYAQRSAAGLSIEAMRDGINPPMASLLTGVLERAAHSAGASGPWTLVAQGLLALWLRIGLQYLFNDAVDRTTAVDTLTRLTVGAIGAVIPDAHTTRATP
jgi:AcrR family transcriptional regulator